MYGEDVYGEDVCGESVWGVCVSVRGGWVWGEMSVTGGGVCMCEYGEGGVCVCVEGDLEVEGWVCVWVRACVRSVEELVLNTPIISSSNILFSILFRLKVNHLSLNQKRIFFIFLSLIASNILNPHLI